MWCHVTSFFVIFTVLAQIMYKKCWRKQNLRLLKHWFDSLHKPYLSKEGSNMLIQQYDGKLWPIENQNTA